ncbi:MAG: thiamine pyrophosphate-dependent enzyme [Segetibacter sp.]
MVVLDTGAHMVWAARYLQLRHRQPVIISSHLGTMGFSLPALIGIQLARPDHRAIGICGDGGFQMVVGELAQLYNPDFVALAKAYGAEAALVDGQTDVAGVLTHAFAKRDKPFLIDCRIDPGLEMPLSKWERQIVDAVALK